MEEHVNENCSIVYFCASAQDGLYELYHKQSLPETHNQDCSLDQTYQNVRTLLDEDQGDFDEVFVGSQPEECLDRLDKYANTAPTIVLVELHTAYDAGHLTPSFLKDKKGSFAFLSALSADIKGARFQKPVLPFALLTVEESTDPEAPLDDAITTNCYQAGAIDILRSPLRHEYINRLIGHVKDNVRPPANLIAAQMAQNLVDSIHKSSEPRIANHRPDQILSSKRKAAVEQAISKWKFPAQDFNMDELTYAAMFMLENILRAPELETYGLSRSQLMSFLLATRRQYKHEREVHYHNWRHAVDVTQSIYCFLLYLRVCPTTSSELGSQNYNTLNAVERMLTPLDGLILIVSAIGHDVGHPGVNNAFLVACNHPLAQTYNDKSVLENYHCAAYSQLLRRHWPALNGIAGFRATMISTILATDMQRHFEYMKNLAELKAKTESSEAVVDDWSGKDREQTRELIMALLIKAADISNVARPFEISANWANILMNEFARQGELETELQIPTCLFGGPPDKEDILAAAQSQKGFMNLFGLPLFQGISEVMPSLSCAVRELENNRDTWDKKANEEMERRKTQPDESHVTLGSVSKDDVEEAKAHRESEPAAVPAQLFQSPSTPTRRTMNSGIETSPSKHAAHDLRQQLAQGISSNDEKRSSMPFLGSHSLPMSSHGTSSRRSSKDVALDQLQQLTSSAQPSLSPVSSSRRESEDAGWQVHQNGSYPSSRRGSKDESLTTILVTSGSTPNRRSSPSSPGKASSLSKSTSKRQSIPQSQKQTAARNSTTSKSQTTSTATATTTQHSPSIQPSTQPSSVAPEDDESQSNARRTTIPSTEDPFMAPENWPNGMDGTTRDSVTDAVPDALPETPPTPASKAETPRLAPQASNGEPDDSRATPRRSEHGVRESRSRSRLRGLKFWKKRKDSSAVDTSTDSTSGSP